MCVKTNNFILVIGRYDHLEIPQIPRECLLLALVREGSVRMRGLFRKGLVLQFGRYHKKVVVNLRLILQFLFSIGCDGFGRVWVALTACAYGHGGSAFGLIP